MGNEETEIKSILLGLERSLLDNSVRTDGLKISEIVDKNFKEYTSSGKVYRYKPGDIFGENKDPTSIITSSFEIISLSRDVKLVNYQTLKKGKNEEIKANRSSIWTKEGKKWKILFHQGTISSESTADA
jgi:hypothetical protein